jgi:hypothetical protein
MVKAGMFYVEIIDGTRCITGDRKGGRNINECNNVVLSNAEVVVLSTTRFLLGPNIEIKDW